MEQESKFLDPLYVETRIREAKEIRNKEYAYKITKSNRDNSKSLYVRFYRVFIYNGEKKYFGDKQLRISDHPSLNHKGTQFLVREDAPLTKGRKALFMRTIEKTIKLAKKSDFMHDLSKLSSNGVNKP